MRLNPDDGDDYGGWGLSVDGPPVRLLTRPCGRQTKKKLKLMMGNVPS